MPAFIFPGRAAKGQRPRGPFSLNRDCWQADGLAFFSSLAPPYLDRIRNIPLVSGPMSTTTVLPPLVGQWDGPASDYVTATPNGMGLNSVPTTQTDNVTTAIWAISRSLSAEQILINVGLGSDGWALETHGDYWKLLINNLARVDSGVGVAVDQPVLVAVRRAATTWQMYLNGVAVGPTSTTTPNTPTSGLSIGMQTDAGAGLRALSGTLWHGAVWNRAFTDAQMWSLYDPATRWDLYWVPGRRVFFDVGAAAATAARARYMPLTGVA